MLIKVLITIAFLLLVRTNCQRPPTLCDDWKMSEEHAELAVALFKDVAGNKIGSSVVSPVSFLGALDFLKLLGLANSGRRYGNRQYDLMTEFLRRCSGGSDIEWSQRFIAHPDLGRDLYPTAFRRWMEGKQYFDIVYPYSPHVPYYYTAENSHSQFYLFERSKKLLASYANRLPFQGVWTVPIPPGRARIGQFQTAYGYEKDMKFVEFTYPVLYGETSSSTVLALEFEGTFDAKMLFILPKDKSRLNEIQKELSGTSLLGLNQTAQTQAVHVKIPLFGIETDYWTEADIKNPNLKHPTELNGGRISWHLNGAKVKSFTGTTYFRVTEWGAAGKGFEPAGPVRSWKTLETVEAKYKFIADRPFLFAVLIRGIVLFLGRFGG